MTRTITLKNLYDKKFKTFAFSGVWADTMGQPETSGTWIIYGPEKNGKTWFSLKLAEYLSSFDKTVYISAEEGTGKTFVDTCQRAGLNPKNKNLRFLEYLPLAELDQKLSERRSARIVIIDNITIYADELKNGGVRKLLKKHASKLLIFVAHEERNEPYTATAKLCRKLAKIIIRVSGLTCFISGRCKGGRLVIDHQKASLFHGSNLPTQEEK